MNRVVVAHTPLPADSLRFRRLRGTEQLSSLYEFAVELVSEDPTVDMKSLLGKPLTLEIQTQGRDRRHLCGQIVRCELSGRETETPRSYIYTLTLRPSLWYLTKTIDCRIFQNKNVLDILDEVFSKYGFPVEKRTSASYRNWEYCVQYQETDFAFVSRLMEHEGIYYYFKHEMGQQTLVLADDLGSHDELPGYATLPYIAHDRLALQDEPGIDQWRSAEEVRSGAYSIDDYDFKKPAAKLGQSLAHPMEHDHAQFEKYIWQGGYIEADQGTHYARIRLEAEQAEHARIRAHSTVRAIACGALFSLTGCPRDNENRQYLIVAVDYDLREGGYATGSNDARYDIDFTVQPAQLPFRAACVTPVPKATGPQTAVVVGPPGQIIWTDQYSRVKLQFRWDRYGNSDENSSCWVRVSDAWAGTNYGSVHVPRIGQEVVVDFLNGQMDRPLITGRIYNADQMPPFEMPVSCTQSGFVTRTPGGGPENANMLRFEDKQGSEQVRLHAERDYDASAEHDSTLTVANKLLFTVGSILTPHDGAQSPLPMIDGAAAGNFPKPSAVQAPSGAEATTAAARTQQQQSASAAAANAAAAQGVQMPPPKAKSAAAGAASAGAGVSAGSGSSGGSGSGVSTSSTGVSVSRTGASFSSTGLSMSSTGASFSSTGLSASATGASFSATGANVSATLADISAKIASASVTMFSVSVQGFTINVTLGGTISVTTGCAISVLNGSSFSDVNGNTSSFVNGNSTSVVIGNTDSAVIGNTASLVCGNSTSVLEGSSHSTTIGSTWSFVEGSTTSTVVGSTMSTVQGSTRSLVVGNTDSTVEGSTRSLVVGNSDSTTEGNINSTTVGNVTTTTLSNDTSLTVGNKTATTIGNKTELTVSNTTSTYIGNTNALTVGSSQNVKIGASTNINATHDTSINTSTLGITGSSISMTGFSFSITQVGYSQTIVDLKDMQSSVEMVGNKMIM